MDTGTRNHAGSASESPIGLPQLLAITLCIAIGAAIGSTLYSARSNAGEKQNAQASPHCKACAKHALLHQD